MVLLGWVTVQQRISLRLKWFFFWQWQLFVQDEPVRTHFHFWSKHGFLFFYSFVNSIPFLYVGFPAISRTSLIYARTNFCRGHGFKFRVHSCRGIPGMCNPSLHVLVKLSTYTPSNAVHSIVNHPIHQPFGVYDHILIMFDHSKQRYTMVIPWYWMS